MDVLLKFANETAALAMGEQFGLYVDAPDGDGHWEETTETVDDGLGGTVEVQRETWIPAPIVKKRVTANYRRGPGGEKLHTVASEIGEVDGFPGYWVLIRTNVDFDTALDQFIEWRSDSGDAYPEDAPQRNFL